MQMNWLSSTMFIGLLLLSVGCQSEQKDNSAATLSNKRLPEFWFFAQEEVNDSGRSLTLYEAWSDGTVRKLPDIRTNSFYPSLAWQPLSEELLMVDFYEAGNIETVALKYPSYTKKPFYDDIGICSADGKALIMGVCNDWTEDTNKPSGQVLKVVDRETKRIGHIIDTKQLKLVSNHHPTFKCIYASWSPNGKQIAFSVKGERDISGINDIFEDLLYIYDTESGLIYFAGFAFSAVWLDNDRLIINGFLNNLEEHSYRKTHRNPDLSFYFQCITNTGVKLSEIVPHTLVCAASPQSKTIAALYSTDPSLLSDVFLQQHSIEINNGTVQMTAKGPKIKINRPTALGYEQVYTQAVAMP